MAIQKGLDVTRESWQVLRADRKLLLFPLFSGLATTIILVIILSAGLLIPGLREWGTETLRSMGHKEPQPWTTYAIGLGCLFALYFVGWFIVVFFNTALVGCVLRRLSGRDATVGDGLRLAVQRLPQILAWTLFTSFVGTVLSAIEQQLGWLGKIAIQLLGVTWAVATYFVVPILAAEGTGPFNSICRSVTLLKQTWGAGLVGNFVIQVFSSAIGIAILLLTTGGLLLAVFTESILIAVATGTTLVIGLMAILIVTSAMRQVFLASLYHYATTGVPPLGYSAATLQHALKQS